MLDVMAITKSAISVSQAALRLSSGHPRYSRRQLLANAAMAASRVATSLRQPRQGMLQRRKDTDRHPLRFCVRALLFGCYLAPGPRAFSRNHTNAIANAIALSARDLQPSQLCG